MRVTTLASRTARLWIARTPVTVARRPGRSRAAVMIVEIGAPGTTLTLIWPSPDDGMADAQMLGDEFGPEPGQVAGWHALEMSGDLVRLESRAPAIRMALLELSG